MLAGGYGNRCAAMNFRETVNLLRMRYFLHPVRSVLLYSVSPLQRVILIPAAKSIEHELGIISYGLPQNAYQFHILIHALRSGTRPVSDEPLLIAITFILVDQCALANRFRFKRKAQTARIHLHRFSRWSTQQPVYRNAVVSSTDIPQGVVDCA